MVDPTLLLPWWHPVLESQSPSFALSDDGGWWSYGELATHSGRVATALSAVTDGLEGGGPDRPPRVAYLIEPGRDHVAVQWGIWRTGAMAVPLAVTHPDPELAHVLDDAEPVVVVAGPENAQRMRALARGRVRVLTTAEVLASDDRSIALGPVSPEADALMIYTSGTTGRPKGVVTTHANIGAQIEALRTAWGWEARDHILHILPLHHIHGVVNVLSCALATGARCTFASFEADAVWERFAEGDLTLFMAVPTVYARLIRAWEGATSETRQRWSDGASRLRLMVSGSAALPVSTLARWKELTGQTLLERYGMTEIGMGLSNPLRAERRAGTVGQPLPGVDLRLVDERGEPVPPGEPGQIQVRGPQVFKEYWCKPDATRAAFRDGWFVTGDQAVLEDGYYKILGRRSVDILKTGGYKVSALEIEAVIREHPLIRDVAVVGVPDPEWGQRVCAACVTSHDEAVEAYAGSIEPGGSVRGEDVFAQELRAWAKERLAPYKVPTAFRFVDDLPRNAMGKVVKPDVSALFTGA